MIIEINKDIEQYKETVVMGLTARQLIYSILALGSGALVILGLYDKIGIMISCYLAMPVIIPLALMGFYSYNNMYFWDFAKRYINSFLQKKLLYRSTESIAELKKLLAK